MVLAHYINNLIMAHVTIISVTVVTVRMYVCIEYSVMYH